MIKLTLLFAAVNGALAIVLGAFGAHGLKGAISETLLAAYKTGVFYHLVHVLALLFIALFMWALRQQAKPISRCLKAAAVLWMSGVTLFSGSLYGLALSLGSWLGPITPIGGMLLIAGWVSLALAIARMTKW